MSDLRMPLFAEHSSSRSVSAELRSFYKTTLVIISSSYMNILLLCIPVALGAWKAGWTEAVVLVFSILALVPLAERIGFITESLAEYTGEYLGGLLNATMGNLPELIVCVTALLDDQFRLVQLSLLGAIFGNLLLVLGHALLSGGIFFPEQFFNLKAAEPQFAILVLASLSLLFPTQLTGHEEQTKTEEVNYSRATSVVMIIEYIALLVFQMVTHNHLFLDDPAIEVMHQEQQVRTAPPSLSGLDMQDVVSSVGNPTDSEETKHSAADKHVEGGQEKEEHEIPFWHAVLWLAILAVFISLLSDAVVEVFTDAAHQLQVPEAFIAAIILPIANNACEHACAVIFASRGQVDLAMGTTVGSAVQIAMFVIPFTVIVAWGLDKKLSLDFHGFETSALMSTVLIVVLSIRTGSSTWITGFFFIGAYVIIALGFWIASDIEFDDDDEGYED